MSSAAPTTDLEAVLANRRWVRRQEPFAHVVAENVFTAPFYATLEHEFQRIEREHPEAFLRSMPGYDASGAEVSTYGDGPLGVFLSREWHNLLAALTGVRGTGDVAATLHHHEPGSASGWPHNDLNPGWFADPPAATDRTRDAASEGVNYHRGTRPTDVTARETVRAVSLLFYLANPPWRPGDGGETGLFPSVDGAARGECRAVAPVNNSLVLFECTPYSWHSFISNATPRNSLVMWIHRDKQEAVDRWGDESIVYW